MRRIFNSWTSKVIGSVMCLMMLAVSADARLYSFRDYREDTLPAIDAFGNVVLADRADASVKATVNTREERIYVQARGYTENLSGEYFYAEDSFLGFDLYGYTIISDIYRVSENGYAYLVARAYELDDIN